MKPYLRCTCICSLLLIASACQTVSTSHVRDSSGPRAAASDPDHIQILNAEPDRPHLRLGEVRAQAPAATAEEKGVQEALRNEAAKLGADAVVVVSDQTQAPAKYVGAWRSSEALPAPMRTVVGVAIKYR